MDEYSLINGRVYLRVCGGTVRERRWPKPTWGLSPRMRRNRISSLGYDRLLRSISAYAEEPCARRGIADGPQVYLRVCGGTAVTASCDTMV